MSGMIPLRESCYILMESSAPYVVGVNPNSPQNPHTAIASGGSDIGNIDTSPPVEAYVLYGGVIGGPDKTDRFWDVRSDWVQGEVSCVSRLTSTRYSCLSFSRLHSTTTPLY
jgi:hypothetical protein